MLGNNKKVAYNRKKVTFLYNWFRGGEITRMISHLPEDRILPFLRNLYSGIGYSDFERNYQKVVVEKVDNEDEKKFLQELKKEYAGVFVKR